MARGFRCPNCKHDTIFPQFSRYMCSNCRKEYIRIKHPNFDEFMEVTEWKG